MVKISFSLIINTDNLSLADLSATAFEPQTGC
jgi:hypothetical protein